MVTLRGHPPYERWPARDVDPKGPAACSIGGLRIVLASLRLVAVAGRCR